MGYANIFGRAKFTDDESHWLSVSDLMAGLMMIFLFISVSYMRHVEVERDKIIEVLETYDKTENAIHSALQEEFKEDFKKWNAELNNLNITFKAPEVLFDQSSSRLKAEFKLIMDDFFPRYVDILNRFHNEIQEVRIEGHTSSEWTSSVSAEIAYFNNMELSQGRTRAVLEYGHSIPGMQYYDWLKGKISAVGMSSSKIIRHQDGEEDRVASRRVEFNILTNFQSLVIDQIKALQIKDLSP